MSHHRRIRSLGVERPGEAYFFEYDEGPPGDGEVRLEALYSGFSAGTELTFFKHTNPYFHARWDAGHGTFHAGEPSLRYPVPFLGYMESARVLESRAAGVADGEVVATAFAHKTGHTANPDHEVLVPMPEGVDPILGIFVAQMGPIAANGVLHADAEVFGAAVPALGAGLAGRPVIVNGAGTVGLLTALFARRASASDVVVCDPSAYRRAKAEAMGLVAMTEEEAARYAKARWHNGGTDRGADFVFQTRAHAGSLHAAMQALRPQGTVIDLAFYQEGAEALRLGEEFHHNGLNLRCAQIGRVPRGLSTSWSRRRLALETLGLIDCFGGILRDEMITHIVPIGEALAFLKSLLDTRPDFLQIVFKMDA